MKKFLLTCFSLALVFTLWAQERTVTGRVTSTEDGSPLPGVNVVVKGTTTGTVTDADGRYSISVPSSQAQLVFSFIGLRSQEVTVGERSVVDVSLALDVSELSEVVVTAQGIARDKRALGYAVSTVGESLIAARPVNDIGRVLQGKIAGVNINPTGGTAGVGSSINIRGYNSLTQSTQPLWVVDGVPFNSSTNNASGFTTGGAATATSRFLDLDPNSIESISVLKGLSATVLYGDQGRNGVILVTTKSGSGKKKAAEVSFQQTLAINQIASLPVFQDNYGNGFQQLFGNFFSNWGPHFAEIDSIGHPYQFSGVAELANAFPEYRFARVAYEAKPNIGGFFRDGLVANTSIGFTGGSDKLSFNSSVGYTSEEGYLPGNDLKRININSGFNAAVSSKVMVKASFQFSETDFETPPLNGATGGGASFGGVPSQYGQFLYTPRSVDLLNWPYKTPTNRSIYFRGPNDIANPRWINENYRETELTRRFFVPVSINYDISDNFSLMYRVGLDTYTTQRERKFNKGGVQGPVIINGVYETRTLTNTIWNHDIILSFNKKISTDFNLVARAGANARNDSFTQDGIYSENQSVYGLFRHFNFVTSSNRSLAFGGSLFQFQSEWQRYGIYGDFGIDYKDFFTLNLSGRNDWTSTLEPGRNSLFYPSASISFIPTSAFSGLRSNTLGFLKFRAGIGTSAGFPTPYNTRTIVGQNLRAFLFPGQSTPTAVHSVSDGLGNPLLKGERIQEIELGAEGRMFNDLISFDFTVYERSTRNLITQVSLDPSTGFTNTLDNLGKIRNRGIESQVTGYPIKNNNLQWEVNWIFNVVRPEVIELREGIDEVPLSGFTDLGNFAVPGRPYNIIKGSSVLKVTDPTSPYFGQRIVGSEGLYELDPSIQEIGNPNPKWTTTLINSVTFKNFTLSVQMEYRHRGDMYAATISALMGRGVTKDTDFNRDLTFILPGVRRLNDGTFAPNDIQITTSDYGFNTQFFGYNEVGIFDATTIRLREIALTYQFPKAFLSKTPFKSGFIQVNGNNLWFNAVNTPKYINFDPEVSSLGVGNGVGFDYLTGPSFRRYGVVLKFTL